MHLLTTSNPKILKSHKFGYETFILHLAPASRSGHNVCPNASKGCMAACLNTSGHGCYERTQQARIRRTKLFFENRAEFFALLIADIYSGIRLAKKHGMIPCFRLNGTSDIEWENQPVTPGHGENIFQVFPDVQFYDYTKIPGRNTPANYHLTFSRSESNAEAVNAEMARGVNVAVVFRKFPEMWNGREVLTGDGSDLRFLDPQGFIIGLTAKGKAKRDTSGFVL